MHVSVAGTNTPERRLQSLAPTVVVPLLLWLAALGLQVGGKVMPAAGLWEGSGQPATVVETVVVESGQVLAGGPTGLYVSTDEGTSWKPAISGRPISALAAGEGRVFAAGPGSLWERRGGVWTAAPPPGSKEIRQLLLLENQLLAATGDGLFARRLDSQAEWQRLWPQPGNEPAQAHSVQGTGKRLLVGTDDGVVERTAENPAWRPLGPVRARVLSLAVGGGWVYAAIAEPKGGLARATIGSDEWQAAQVASEFGAAVLVDPRNPSRVYAGLGGLADGRLIAGVILSEDAGTHWTPVRSRLLNVYVPALALDEARGVLYAGTNGGGVFRYREPTLLHQALESLNPALDLAEPALLGLVALALLLRRRPPKG